MSAKVPSQQLRVGRRALDGHPNCHIVSPLNWRADLKQWHMKLRLKSTGSDLVPEESDWDLLLGEEYPWGEIYFHPSSTNSVEVTFPHQTLNTPLTRWPWRMGYPCLSTDIASLNRVDVDQEPTTAAHRLLWHVNRLFRWLELAATNSLLSPGDPFELPVFRGDTNEPLMFAFEESPQSYDFWKSEIGMSGVCALFPYHQTKIASKKKNIIFVKGFKTESGQERTISWGREIEGRYNKKRQIISPWILLPSVPTTVAWQAPQTWQELADVCLKHDVELANVLYAYLDDLREQTHRILLIGMPLPRIVGDPPCQVQWQALKVPKLSDKDSFPRGFRNNKLGRYYRDSADIGGILKSRCEWIPSENWHKGEITARGVFRAPLQQQRALIIGAGAIGSYLSEGLVRNGLENVLLSDVESLAVGNLTRHTLGIDGVGHPKPQEVAKRLNQAAPHANVGFLQGMFPPKGEANIKLVQQNELVIDCTGSDKLLVELASFDWLIDKAFFSFSLGLNGKRMFAYFAKSIKFPFEDFRAQLKKWLVFEKQTLGADHPREGTGCWHSVFPARNDDIQLFSASAVKFIEDSLLGTATNDFAVFEQVYDHGRFVGIRRLSEPE